MEKKSCKIIVQTVLKLSTIICSLNDSFPKPYIFQSGPTIFGMRTHNVDSQTSEFAQYFVINFTMLDCVLVCVSCVGFVFA